MSKAQITFLIISNVLIAVAVPFLVMSYRRNKECRYFSIAHFFLFLGVGLSAWLPLMKLPGGAETAIYIFEFCSLTAYVAMMLWIFIKWQRIYNRTGKWPNIWAVEDTRV